MKMLQSITITELQRNTKSALESVKDYAVIQSHGKEVALILSPKLGQVLIQSGQLQELMKRCVLNDEKKDKDELNMEELDSLIGNVLIELSKK